MRRREAVIIDGKLHFLPPMGQRHMLTVNRIIQSERCASDVYIRGISCDGTEEIPAKWFHRESPNTVRSEEAKPAPWMPGTDGRRAMRIA